MALGDSTGEASRRSLLLSIGALAPGLVVFRGRASADHTSWPSVVFTTEQLVPRDDACAALSHAPGFGRLGGNRSHRSPGPAIGTAARALEPGFASMAFVYALFLGNRAAGPLARARDPWIGRDVDFRDGTRALNATGNEVGLRTGPARRWGGGARLRIESSCGMEALCARQVAREGDGRARLEGPVVQNRRSTLREKEPELFGMVVELLRSYLPEDTRSLEAWRIESFLPG